MLPLLEFNYEPIVLSIDFGPKSQHVSPDEDRSREAGYRSRWIDKVLQIIHRNYHFKKNRPYTLFGDGRKEIHLLLPKWSDKVVDRY